MKKESGFSLAEALITLLIVCIIAIVTAPMITKKAGKNPDNVLWIKDTIYKNAVLPNGGKDIRLGQLREGQTQSIIVIDRLYFKNRKGDTIGWIAEDGTSSFAQNGGDDTAMYEAVMANQQKIMQTLSTLNTMINSSQNNNNVQSRRTGHRNRQNSSMPTIPDNKGDNEELQKQLNDLLNGLNNTNNSNNR